jgi:hypothetical protein
MKNLMHQFRKICNSNLFSLLLIALAAIILNKWVLDFSNFFVFDDYSWLYVSQFNTYSEIINILPNSVYNDRPVGAVFMKVLYDLFGFNHQSHHLVLFIIHVLNAWAVFFIIKYAMVDLKVNEKKFPYIPLISALIFAIWAKSTMAIQWEAAIFDLLGTALALSGLLIYLRNRVLNKYNGFTLIVLMVLLFLSLRTKEMFLVVPFILLSYEVVSNYIDKKNLLKITVKVKALLSISFLYAIMLFALKSSESVASTPDNPYYLDFNLITIARNIFRYIFLFFNFSGSEFSFMLYRPMGVILACLFLTIFILSLILIKKYFFISYLFIVSFMALGPVLLMKNMQHNLYLYFSSVFIAIILASLIQILINFILKNKVYQLITVIATIALFSWFQLTNQSVIDNRNYWSSVGANNNQSFNDLSLIEKPQENTQIYIDGIADGHHIFFYGPGFINNLIFNDKTLQTSLSIEEIDRTKPFLILNYNQGIITEVERSK